MSRTYAYKPDIKPKNRVKSRDKNVVLADFEIKFIEMSLGPSIRLTH